MTLKIKRCSVKDCNSTNLKTILDNKIKTAYIQCLDCGAVYMNSKDYNKLRRIDIYGETRKTS